jgi:hypothetical protein
MPAPTSVPAVLRAAADLLAKPGGWNQRWVSADAQGNPVGLRSDEAVCFCIYGATMRVSPDLYDDAVLALRRVHPLPSIWNEDRRRTQEEAVTFVRKAADLAEAEQAVS